jgi:hypothetical protein
MWGTLSDERSGLLFSVVAGPYQQSLSQVLSPTGLMIIRGLSVKEGSQ